MKKTHVPCSLKIEEEAVRYDLDNPTKRNTAKLLQLFLTALGYFGSVLVICDLYGTNIRKGIFLPLAVGGFLLASLLQFLPKHSGKLTLGFVLVLLGMSALFSKQIVLGFHAIFNVVYQTAHNTNIAYFQIAKRANITFAATLTAHLWRNCWHFSLPSSPFESRISHCLPQFLSCLQSRGCIWESLSAFRQWDCFWHTGAACWHCGFRHCGDGRRSAAHSVPPQSAVLSQHC